MYDQQLNVNPRLGSQTYLEKHSYLEEALQT